MDLLHALGEAAREFQVGGAGLAPHEIRVFRVGDAAREGLVEALARLVEALGGALAGEERLVVLVDVRSDEVRGLGVFWALDLVTDRATREMLAPYGGTSPAMTELVGEARKRGLMPFTNYNRLHVVPPCTVSDTEAKEGLAILDEVFSVVDRHYTG